MSNEINHILRKVADKELTAEEAVKYYCDLKKSDTSNKRNRSTDSDVAIVGMSGRFASAANLDEYWTLLQKNICGIVKIPPNRTELLNCTLEEKQYIAKCGYLSQIDQFDPYFFQITPKEADYIDPRQRLFLEEVWKAIEDSGHIVSDYAKDKCGVFVGLQQGEYLERFKGVVNENVPVGNSLSVIPSRVSYLFDLKGPSIAIDTACSSSLTALSLAYDSIVHGICDTAIVGGIQVMIEPDIYCDLGKLGMISKTGKCRPFDEEADGIGLGEGIGVVILKRLDQALNENDRVYGIIEAVGLNQDGKTNGITAPNGLSQESLIRDVYKKYGIKTSDISYIESHGTGTKLGDPIEFRALKNVFGDKSHTPCVLSSVKGNIGHTLSASGIASLIKVLLSMKNATIPAIANLKTPNALIELNESNLCLAENNVPWPRVINHPRRAAISSFGMSGTNCHVVVREYNHTNKKGKTHDGAQYFLFALSAKTKIALKKKIDQMIDYLNGKGKDEDLADICYSSVIGREAYEYRIAYVVKSAKELIEYLVNERLDDSKKCLKQNNIQHGKNVLLQGEKNRFLNKAFLEAEKDKFLNCEYYNITHVYQGITAQRITLPSYPFEYMSCWKESNKNYKRMSNTGWLHSDNSDMERKLFTSVITSDNNHFYTKRLYKTAVVPEGYLIDIMMEAGMTASRKPLGLFEHIRFYNCLSSNTSQKQIELGLTGNNDHIEFILNIANKNQIISDGVLCLDTPMISDSIDTAFDLDFAERSMFEKRDKESFYDALVDQGYFAMQESCFVDQVRYGFGCACIHLDVGSMIELRLGYIIEQISQVLNYMSIQEGKNLRSIYEIVNLHCYEQIKHTRHLLVRHLNNYDNSFCVIGYDETGERISLYIEQLDIADIEVSKGLCDESVSIIQREWRPQKIQEESHSIIDRPLILCNASVTQDAISAIKRRFANADFVVNGETGLHLTEPKYIADFSSVKSCDECYQVIADKQYDAIIDISDLYKDEMLLACYGKISLYQRIIRESVAKGLRVFHFTYKTQTLGMAQRSLNGTLTAGLIRILSREYRNVNAKTIDSDRDFVDIDEYLNIVSLEDSGRHYDTEIMYENGNRYIPNFKTAKIEDKWNVRAEYRPISLNPEKVYIITGGLRGIGAQVAQRFAYYGAKKLVLTGITPMPDRTEWDTLIQKRETSERLKQKIQLILELEKKNVTVRVYSHSLSDQEKLQDLMDQIQVEMGELGGIIHCAGSSIDDDPLFINKDIKCIQTVYEPKVEALHALHGATKDHILDFFLIFSSISGAMPEMGVGMSDYGTANYYAERFANHQHNNGFPYYQAIVWPSWKEVGMLVDKKFVPGEQYKQLGLKLHGVSDGLLLLENVICDNEFLTGIAAIVDKESYSVEAPFALQGEVREGSNHKDVNAHADNAASNEMIAAIRRIFHEELHIHMDKLDDDTEFAKLGLDSILLINVIKRLEAEFQIIVEPAWFFEYPKLREFAQYLCYECDMAEDPIKGIGTDSSICIQYKAEYRRSYCIDSERGQGQRSVISESETFTDAGVNKDKIAIIGIACRFPGAENRNEFWGNLVDGKSSIREVPKSRWDIEDLYSPEPRKGKSAGKWGGFLTDIENFDGKFFGFNGRLEQLSPLMRLYLEGSVEAVLDAGYNLDDLSGKKVGVFVGTHAGSYPSWVDDFDKDTIIGIGQNFIASYLSHFLNLTGPSFVVDSACSSSLTSVHLACQSLWCNESEMAIAGGVDLLLDERPYLVFSGSKAMSPDGKCHTFDLKANGIVPGEGCGAIILKPLTKALRDNDTIYAVIEGSATNNDGRTMGVTTPNINAQEEVIASAIKKADVDPRSIGYVEVHGTGTMIGDPIELKALTRVYQQYTNERQYCGIGSVKTNIGHCLSAAGIASLIKTVLCIHNKALVPTLNCEEPNPRFSFSTSPFYPVLQSKEWTPINGIYRAAVSSFGFGGTNVHMILANSSKYQNSRELYKRLPLPSPKYNKEIHWVSRGRKSNETINVQTADSEKETTDRGILTFEEY